jgi:hypothetical protein
VATIKGVKPRAKARVEDTEKSSRATKQADHRGAATVMDNGELEISFQLSELVPVAQYANVTIGPVQLRWKTANPGIEKLGTVDWEDGDSLDAEQQEVYEKVRGYLRATSTLIEHHVAEDREAVEESVRLHNEREAEEAASTKKSPRRRSR